MFNTLSKLLQVVSLTGFVLSVQSVSAQHCYGTTEYGNCGLNGQVLGGTCTLQTCVPYIPTQCGCVIATSDCIIGTKVQWDWPCGNTSYYTSKSCTVSVVYHQFVGCAYSPPWTTQNGVRTGTCNCSEAGGGDPCLMSGCYMAKIDGNQKSTVASR
jgi:hypothetical protein